MRRAPIPHAEGGNARVCSRRKGWLRLVRALVLLSTLALALTLIALPSTAQDPSIFAGTTQKKSSFAKQKGGILGPTPHIDSAQPLYLQADQLLYDTKNS